MEEWRKDARSEVLIGFLIVVVHDNLDQTVFGFLVGKVASGCADLTRGGGKFVYIDAACRADLVFIGEGDTGNENRAVIEIRL